MPGPPLQIGTAHLPLALLVAAPVLVSATGAGVFSVVALLTIVLFLRFALHLKAMSVPGPVRYQLESVAASHYVEYVRWSMDTLNEPYDEIENVSIMGAFLFGRTVPALHIPKNRTTVSNSRDILRYLYGKCILEDRAAFLKPVDGIGAELEDKFEKLGEHTRRWIFYTLFYRSGVKGRELSMRAMGRYQTRIQLWQRLALPALYPVLKVGASKRLRIDESGFHRSVAEIDKTFDEMDTLLSDGRMYLLATPEKMYLDICLACMAALVILPPEYSGGRIEERSKLNLSDLSPNARKEVETWRSRPTGKFVLRMYANERALKQL